MVSKNSMDYEDHIQNCILVAADLKEYDIQSSLDELEELATTAGAKVIARVTQQRSGLDSATYIGDGKLNEIKEFIKSNPCELLIFNDELSGTQIRNIEEIVETKVVDRTTLILDIFAGRAISSEGKLQVELAQLQYSMPRLIGLGISLSRLAGGIGTRGPGESKLESDKRHIRRRIDNLKEELAELTIRRKLIRDRRTKNNIPTICIVGYTNAGKSTLLNKLCNADVLAEDKLFATLDPTVRELRLPNGQNSVVIDTVGLIRRLPHKLVEAFKSTLEEATSADIILNVVDITNDEYKEHIDVTLNVLNDLGCANTPIITVFNKSDKLEVVPHITELNSVYISATKDIGMDKMLSKIVSILDEQNTHLTIEFPYNKIFLIDKIRENGKVISEEYTENGVLVEFNVPTIIWGGIKKNIDAN